MWVYLWLITKSKRTRQFQCAYHPEFQTNSIDDFKDHLTSHQKITKSNIVERIPEVLTESGLVDRSLLLD
jgi:hypothetical protein